MLWSFKFSKGAGDHGDEDYFNLLVVSRSSNITSDHVLNISWLCISKSQSEFTITRGWINTTKRLSTTTWHSLSCCYKECLPSTKESKHVHNTVEFDPGRWYSTNNIIMHAGYDQRGTRLRWIWKGMEKTYASRYKLEHHDHFKRLHTIECGSDSEDDWQCIHWKELRHLAQNRHGTVDDEWSIRNRLKVLAPDVD